MQCVDAETLAAWADGGLSKTEAAAVELHVSECDHCTAMVATFVRTTPDAPAEESLWRRLNMRWLVPVATAATVAALWVLIPSSDRAPTTTLESEVATQATAPAPALPPPSPADTKEQKLEDTRARSDRSAAVAQRQEAAPPFERPQTRDEARGDLRAAEETAAAPPPAPAREADRAGQAVQQAPPVQPSTSSLARARAPAAAPTTATESRRDGALQQGNTQAFAAVVAQFEVVSPDPMTRWRVIGAGRVERSTNGGAQWEPAALPEAATLTGGSSPAPSICWLVGRTGAMYVTTDGLRFVRVPFRERTDFISIQAIDGRRATVVTTDGRTMRTEDQGATWTRIAP